MTIKANKHGLFVIGLPAYPSSYPPYELGTPAESASIAPPDIGLFSGPASVHYSDLK